MHYPIEKREFICSDGRIFYDEDEARQYQKHLDNDERVVYSAEQIKGKWPF